MTYSRPNWIHCKPGGAGLQGLAIWILTNLKAPDGLHLVSRFPRSFSLLYSKSSRNVATEVKALGHTEKEHISWEGPVSQY